MKDIILVAGSTAIDQTGIYNGSFKGYQDQYRIDALNMSFQLMDVKTSFGGCAPNIAWGLHQLGVNVIPLSSAGRNFRDRYEPHLRANGINTEYITVDESVEHCASCMMLNDLHGNQVIGFYSGPNPPKRKLPGDIAEIDRVALFIMGPEDPELTLKQARDIEPRDLPMIFDPGQVITDFNRAQILALLDLSDYLIVNDYEHQVLLTNAGLQEEELVGMVPEVVITHGDKGVDVYSHGRVFHIDAVRDVEIVEVTGCGDAFRAGYAWGILTGVGPVASAQVGCIMAMLNLKSLATQNYTTSAEAILTLQKQIYA